MENDRLQKKEHRKYHILGHIVNEYVHSSVPVSSKVVARLMGDSVSSATIRNIMSELEEEGYIAQPHTSAGRIPTNVGYRHYVDIIKEKVRLEKKQAERLAGNIHAEYVLSRKLLKKRHFY